VTSLTFYGGVNEIWGNKILLEDKDTKVFLDFGMNFGKRWDYLDRVYRSDLMEMMGEKETDTDIDAVLLTHAHADHADYISFLHEDIPIYTVIELECIQ